MSEIHQSEHKNDCRNDEVAPTELCNSFIEELRESDLKLGDRCFICGHHVGRHHRATTVSSSYSSSSNKYYQSIPTNLPIWNNNNKEATTFLKKFEFALLS